MSTQLSKTYRYQAIKQKEQSKYKRQDYNIKQRERKIEALRPINANRFYTDE